MDWLNSIFIYLRNLLATDNTIVAICNGTVIIGFFVGCCRKIYKLIKNHTRAMTSIRNFFRRIHIVNIFNLVVLTAFVFGTFFNLYLVQKGKKYVENQQTLYAQMQKTSEEINVLASAQNLPPEIDLEIQYQNLKVLYDDERKMLYPEIQNYIKPFVIFETRRDTVRIDQIENHKYRYSIWKLGKIQSEKPDLIVETNKVSFENGITTFVFRNGVNDYYDYVVSLSENMENDTLKVYHNTIPLSSYEVLKVLFKGY